MEGGQDSNQQFGTKERNKHSIRTVLEQQLKKKKRIHKFFQPKRITIKGRRMNEMFLRENLEKDDHLRTMKCILKNTLSGQEKTIRKQFKKL